MVALGTEHRGDTSRGLHLRWVVANVVGFTAGGAIAGTIAREMGQSNYGVVTSTGDAVLIATRTAGTALAVWGAAVGAAQWLVIRRDLTRVGWWVPGTSAGWALAGVVGDPQRIHGRGGDRHRPRCRGVGLRCGGSSGHPGPGSSARHVPMVDAASTPSPRRTVAAGGLRGFPRSGCRGRRRGEVGLGERRVAPPRGLSFRQVLGGVRGGCGTPVRSLNWCDPGKAAAPFR